MAKSRATNPTPKRPWRERFLKQLATGVTFTEAAAAAGVDRSHVYHVIEKDKDFSLAYADALKQRADVFEAAIKKRAIDGVETYVVQDGAIVFIHVDKNGKPIPPRGPGSRATGKMVPLVKREFSDGLASRMLAAHKPELYRERVGIVADTPTPATRADAVTALDQIITRLKDDAAAAVPAAKPKEKP